MDGMETGLIQISSTKLYGTEGPGIRYRTAGSEVLIVSAAVLLCLLYFILILLPIIAMAAYSGLYGLKALFTDSGILMSIKVSFFTSSVALLLTFCLGTPAAFFIMNGRSRLLSKLLEILTGLPVVLPPAAAGMALLLVFGRSGPLGVILDSMDADIVFTPYAVILAQFFVSSGFYIQVIGTGIAMIEKEIYDVSYIMGAGRLETFFLIVLPIVRKSIIAGLLLSWARSMGEFGATIIFAGNVEGMTRTMPLEIYTLMQTDIVQAAAVSMLLVVISFIALFVVKVWIKE